MNILDRIFLFRYKISKEIRASKMCTVFIDSDREKIILKFSYSGNVQYHELDPDEAMNISATINEAVQKFASRKS